MIFFDFYLNVGGVIVFYFEWLKNFFYMCFGCMEKCFNQQIYINIINLVEEMIGKVIMVEQCNVIVCGVDEIDLVCFGLEEMMIVVYY